MIKKAAEVARAFATRQVPFDVDLVPVPVDGLPLRKVVNWLLTESSVYVKPERPWGFPTVLQVEPTSLCNLRCRICPVATGLDRPVGHMSYELFQQIIDQLGDRLLVLMLWDWGEPFLNPRIYDMIRYARAAGVRVVTSTNGHLFANAENAAKVVASGVDQLVFSVDGITQGTYERYRVRGDLETVLEGVQNVVAEKRRQQASHLVVNFRFIVMKHNQHETPRLQEFAGPLGVDVLTLRRFYSVPNDQNDDTPDSERLIPDQTAFQLPVRSGDNGRPIRVTKNPCRNLWNCPTIHWDGTVCSCFMDFNEKRPLGKLPEQRFEDIWRGETYRNLRRAFRNAWLDLSPCSMCSSGYQRGDVGREANAEATYFAR